MSVFSVYYVDNFTRVSLDQQPGIEGSDYINASYIDVSHFADCALAVKPFYNVVDMFPMATILNLKRFILHMCFSPLYVCVYVLCV